LQHDPAYAAKAARVSSLTRDLSEVVLAEADVLQGLFPPSPEPLARVAFHAPCTLQHGQKITGVVEALLSVAGFEVVTPSEANLCCGSAGTYSILQPDIASQLRARKLGHLQAQQPEIIATANIGCLTHLQAGTATPVRHWIELLDANLS
jgi:glycolate oxidase iron-sulfur subunit